MGFCSSLTLTQPARSVSIVSKLARRRHEKRADGHVCPCPVNSRHDYFTDTTYHVRSWNISKTIMKSHLLSLCLVAGASVFGAEVQPLYLDASQPVEARVEDLFSRLTLDEKMVLIHADSKFTSAAIARLGVPRRWM